MGIFLLHAFMRLVVRIANEFDLYNFALILDG